MPPIYDGMNAYGFIIQKAWELMSIEWNINGFTISFAGVFIFHLMCIFLVRAICVYFLLKG